MDRETPREDGSEMSLAGCVWLAKDWAHALALKCNPEEFFLPHVRCIVRVARALAERGEPIDGSAILSHLKAKEITSVRLGQDAIEEAGILVKSLHSAEEHLVRVKKAARLREQQKEVEAALENEAADNYTDGCDAASASETELLKLAGLNALGESPSLNEIGATLRRLRKFLDGADPLRRTLVRSGAIQLLVAAKVNGPAALVDAALHTNESKEHLDLKTPVEPLPELWHQPVKGAALLDELCSFYSDHLILPAHGAEAMALWGLHAHALDAAFITPRLVFKSPAMRSGKTRALELLDLTTPSPCAASNITGPGIFRVIELYHPTMLLDEADVWAKTNDEIRGLLNAGQSRKNARVIRLVGDDHEPRVFSTFAAIAVALIGDLPNTVEDRAVVLKMRRKKKSERVKRLRLDRVAEYRPLKEKSARWAADNIDALKAADPVMPEIDNDRALDNWRPLVAIADAAGGSWPDRARKALLAMSGAIDEASNTFGIRALFDVRDIFDRLDKEKLPSKDMMRELLELEDSPWSGWSRGRGLTQNTLSTLLKPFEIVSKPIWTPTGTFRGYLRAEFEDAWERYSSGKPPSQGARVQGANTDADLDPKTRVQGTPPHCTLKNDLSRDGQRCLAPLHSESADPGKKDISRPPRQDSTCRCCGGSGIQTRWFEGRQVAERCLECRGPDPPPTQPEGEPAPEGSASPGSSMSPQVPPGPATRRPQKLAPWDPDYTGPATPPGEPHGTSGPAQRPSRQGTETPPQTSPGETSPGPATPPKTPPAPWPEAGPSSTPAPPGKSCHACGGSRFWRSRHGVLLCVTCRPPPAPPPPGSERPARSQLPPPPPRATKPLGAAARKHLAEKLRTRPGDVDLDQLLDLGEGE